MAGKCSICKHPEVDAINKALVDGVGISDMVRQYGFSRDTFYRHKNRHLPQALLKAQEVKEVAVADSLLGQVKDLQAKTLGILNRHEGKNDRIALSAIREARSNLDLLGRLLGELDDSPKVAVLVANPEWVNLRTLIIEALEPYPEAKRAVVYAIQSAKE